jgi:hypothetical protein
MKKYLTKSWEEIGGGNASKFFRVRWDSGLQWEWRQQER